MIRARPEWRNGIRSGFKNHRPKGIAGSNPASGMCADLPATRSIATVTDVTRDPPFGDITRPGDGGAACPADVMITMINTYAYLHSLVAVLRSRERGQTMAEYAVVLSVIVIAIIVALTALAGGVTKTLGSVTSKL
jgi:Flp pilus assembly pilin Flp